jgi:hypothetical protein
VTVGISISLLPVAALKPGGESVGNVPAAFRQGHPCQGCGCTALLSSRHETNVASASWYGRRIRAAAVVMKAVRCDAVGLFSCVATAVAAG